MDKIVLKKINTQAAVTEEREAGGTLNFTWIQAAAWKNKTVKVKVFLWGVNVPQYRGAVEDND